MGDGMLRGHAGHVLPRVAPPPGATSWAIPGAAVPTTSITASAATPTTRLITHSLLWAGAGHAKHDHRTVASGTLQPEPSKHPQV